MSTDDTTPSRNTSSRLYVTFGAVPIENPIEYLRCGVAAGSCNYFDFPFAAPQDQITWPFLPTCGPPRRQGLCSHFPGMFLNHLNMSAAVLSGSSIYNVAIYSIDGGVLWLLVAVWGALGPFWLFEGRCGVAVVPHYTHVAYPARLSHVIKYTCLGFNPCAAKACHPTKSTISCTRRCEGHSNVLQQKVHPPYGH